MVGYRGSISLDLTLTLLLDETPLIPRKASVSAGDPDEVDISEHFYEPKNSRQRMTPQPDGPYPALGGDLAQINDETLRAMMLGVPPGAGGPQGPQSGMNNLFGGLSAGGDGANGAEEPMMAMMQQMMGGAAGQPGGLPSFPGMPPMGLPGQQAQGVVADSYAYLWRLVHALFAIGLGIYISMTVSFSGTKLAREESALLDVGCIKQLFWIGEAMLLGRFLFKGGQASGGEGMIGMILPMIPQPYGGYIRWVMRYSSILRTIWGDALLVVFTLGAMSWWNNGGMHI